MRNILIASVVSIVVLGVVVFAGTEPASAPTTRPATDTSAPSPESLLDKMLKPVPGQAKPLQPVNEKEAVDKKSGTGSAAVAPKTPPVPVQREGTFIFDRPGRLTRSPDGTQAEFTFESDGKTLKDPPVIILPNLKLMTMEDAVKSSNRDLRFRITGMLTEYRGRNYLLLEKVLVPAETQF